jgi:hypothetical protein
MQDSTWSGREIDSFEEQVGCLWASPEAAIPVIKKWAESELVVWRQKNPDHSRNLVLEVAYLPPGPEVRLFAPPDSTGIPGSIRISLTWEERRQVTHRETLKVTVEGEVYTRVKDTLVWTDWEAHCFRDAIHIRERELKGTL